MTEPVLFVPNIATIDQVAVAKTSLFRMDIPQGHHCITLKGTISRPEAWGKISDALVHVQHFVPGSLCKKDEPDSPQFYAELLVAHAISTDAKGAVTAQLGLALTQRLQAMNTTA